MARAWLCGGECETRHSSQKAAQGCKRRNGGTVTAALDREHWRKEAAKLRQKARRLEKAGEQAEASAVRQHVAYANKMAQAAQ